MKRSEIEAVLTNWIEQAYSPIGRLDEGVDPAKWIADNFLNWWCSAANEALVDAECAASALRNEFIRLGGGNNPDFGEAMHELTHLTESLRALRAVLELDD